MSLTKLEYKSASNNDAETLPNLEEYEQPSLRELSRRQEIVARVTEPCTFEPVGSLETPLVQAEIVHAEANAVGSFKLRGAYLAMVEAQNNGWTEYVTSSAGNHSQGMAFATNALNIDRNDKAHVTVFMPSEAPENKKLATSMYGGDFVTVSADWDGYEDSERAAINYANQTKSHYISPFDNLDVIAGQGTVAYEALIARPNTSRLFVSCGGGGLLAGSLETVASLKSAGKIRPDFKVTAVMLEGNDSLIHTLLAEGKPQPASNVNTLCEGSAVKTIGALPAVLIWKYREHLETIIVSAAELGEAALAWEDRAKRWAEYGTEPFKKPETAGLLAEAGQLKLAKERVFRAGKAPEEWLAMCTGHNVDESKWKQAKQIYQQEQSEAEDLEESQVASRVIGKNVCRIASSPATRQRIA